MSSVSIDLPDRRLTWSDNELARVETALGSGQTLQSVSFPSRDEWAADITERGGVPPSVDDAIAGIEARIAELQAQIEDLRA